MEEWKDIVGYEGRYQVSDLGRVRSLVSEGKVMNQMVHYRGYLYLFLYKDGRHKKHFIHRLVAIAFIVNEKDLEIVNHKNMNKKCNRLDNLEWMSCGDNTRHYFANRNLLPDTNF